MQHKIDIKPEYAMLDVTLDPGEKLIAESGAMVGMDTHLDMKAQSRGGMLKGIKRKLMGGESFFQTTYTATSKAGQVLIAPGSPGDIEEKVLGPGQNLMLQSSAFLACTDGVELDTKWGGAKGFFSGTGMFLLKATGPGTVWYSTFGAVRAIDVKDEFVVDTGHIVAFEETLNYGISKVGGLKGLLFSGEGLVARFKGQGTLWIQTRNPASFAAYLNPFRPVEKS